MEKLLMALATALVDNKEDVSVAAAPENEEGLIVYHLRVAQSDMGRVIGKGGKIAKSIRTIMRSAANREGFRIGVEIDQA